MSNKTIATVCRMVAAGKDLKAVQAYLDPVNKLPARSDNCVVREAWNIAVRQARFGAKAAKPIPTKGEKMPIASRARKYRAEKRNRRYDRPNIGNRTPAWYARRSQERGIGL